jgi:hypothetical protein
VGISAGQCSARPADWPTAASSTTCRDVGATYQRSWRKKPPVCWESGIGLLRIFRNGFSDTDLAPTYLPLSGVAVQNVAGYVPVRYGGILEPLEIYHAANRQLYFETADPSAGHYRAPADVPRVTRHTAGEASQKQQATHHQQTTAACTPLTTKPFGGGSELHLVLAQAKS